MCAHADLLRVFPLHLNSTLLLMAVLKFFGELKLNRLPPTFIATVLDWAKSATHEVVDTLKEGAEYLSDTTAVRRVSGTVESAYETAADYLPETDENSSLTASLINMLPFSSFKSDPGNVWKAYLIYVLLAAACTLPLWSFVVAADYFSFLYPDSHILRLFPLFYFSPWLVVYVLFSAFGRQYTSWGRINYRRTEAVHLRIYILCA
ncbi:hypothetical protein R1flu_011308 [Riccia fluitans]|uniref:Uncharacterized protein n=1 Tax=Riccia fluitans TaxID=41844 RepID=A0ABD1Z7F3_9MARC